MSCRAAAAWFGVAPGDRSLLKILPGVPARVRSAAAINANVLPKLGRIGPDHLPNHFARDPQLTADRLNRLIP